MLAYRALRALEPGASDRQLRRNVMNAMRETADGLGNTAAVARASYVHPAVVDAYLDGQIRAAVRAAERTSVGDPPDRAEELEVARLLSAAIPAATDAG